MKLHDYHINSFWAEGKDKYILPPFFLLRWVVRWRQPKAQNQSSLSSIQDGSVWWWVQARTDQWRCVDAGSVLLLGHNHSARRWFCHSWPWSNEQCRYPGWRCWGRTSFTRSQTACISVVCLQLNGTTWRSASCHLHLAFDKLPPTQGAWKQHIQRAHLQANISAQDLKEKPVTPNSLTLGWKKEGGTWQVVACTPQRIRLCSGTG